MPKCQPDAFYRQRNAHPITTGVLPVIDGTSPRRLSAWRAWSVLGCLAMLAAPAIAQPSMFHTRIEVCSRGLDIHGGVFRKTIPMADLEVWFARIVDLDREPGLRPGFKIYGVGLPTYRSGWYRPKDGQKAVVALARSQAAVSVPTTRGYAVLVGPEDPAGFLAALQRPDDGGRIFSVEKTH
jgi:Bacterial PH domain